MTGAAAGLAEQLDRHQEFEAQTEGMSVQFTDLRGRGIAVKVTRQDGKYRLYTESGAELFIDAAGLFRFGSLCQKAVVEGQPVNL